MKWQWNVSPEYAGQRLDKVITIALESNLGEWTDEEDIPDFSRSQIEKLIESGHLLLNSKTTKTNTKLNVDDEIEFTPPAPTLLDLIPENIPLDILYEDADLLIVNKPRGLTVHPSATQMTGTLVHALLYHIKDLSGIGGKLRPGIVHRIDKDTSGAICITKNDKTHKGMSELFSKHDIDRKYWAFCYAAPKWDTQRLETFIDRAPHDRKKMSCDLKEGRKAVSHFKVIERFAQAELSAFASIIEATLETGRTHQVRVHLTHLQHSLLGDKVYGMPTHSQHKFRELPANIRVLVDQLNGQALHARTLGFIHPNTGSKVFVEAPLPTQLQELHQALKQWS